MYRKINKNIFKIPFLLDPITKDFKLNKKTNIDSTELSNDVSYLIKNIWASRKWLIGDKIKVELKEDVSYDRFFKGNERNRIIEELLSDESSRMIVQENPEIDHDNELSIYLNTARYNRHNQSILNYWRA